jgi:opacity protein-like surface antigen
MQHGDMDDKESIFGFNIGAGAEYYLQSNLKLNLDIKYQYNKKTKSESVTYKGQTVSYDYDIKFDGPVFQMGIAYIF